MNSAITFLRFHFCHRCRLEREMGEMDPYVWSKLPGEILELVSTLLSPLPPPETSYNKHKHVLLNICIQFHNYQHPLRISLLKTCFKGIQFFIKRTFYSQDTFCKSS
jgi:hypothetical protein